MILPFDILDYEDRGSGSVQMFLCLCLSISPCHPVVKSWMVPGASLHSPHLASWLGRYQLLALMFRASLCHIPAFSSHSQDFPISTAHPASHPRAAGRGNFFLFSFKLSSFQVTKPGKLFVFISTVLLGFGMRTTCLIVFTVTCNVNNSVKSHTVQHRHATPQTKTLSRPILILLQASLLACHSLAW